MHVGSVESASVRISVVKTVMKWDSSSLHSLTRQRDSGSSDGDFMAMLTTPILLESNESEVSCLHRNVTSFEAGRTWHCGGQGSQVLLYLRNV